MVQNYLFILGPNFKVPKTYEKQLYNHITVVLCKKFLGKAPLVVKMTRFSTTNFGKFLKPIVRQHDEKWLILGLNFKGKKHTKYDSDVG